MTSPDVEADWLQDTLADVARRLRSSGISRRQLTECASILERIVSDLRGTPMPQTPPAAAINRRTRWWVTVLMGFGLFLLMRRFFRDDCNP
jgi:hypothetical protein